MSTFMMEQHTWTCQSPRLEKALTRGASERNDAAFQALVACLALDAARGVTLYSPVYPMEEVPMQFRVRNCPAMVLYLDETAAGKCGHLCNTTDDHRYFLTMERAVPVPLGDALTGLRNAGGALALNLGLKNTVVLPPQVVDTIQHLYQYRSAGWKFPAGSAWNEWAGIVDRFAQSPDAARTAPETREAGKEEVTVPIGNIRRDGKRSVFCLE